MAEVPIGALIRTYRHQRRLTTVYVATHAEITSRYLEMIEAGTKTPTIDTLRRIARVLGVRTSALLGEPPSESYEGPVNPRLAAIERALFTYRSLASTSEPPDLADLSAHVDAAWQAWFTSPTKYTDVLHMLPDMISESERAVHAYEGGQRREACRIAAETLHLSRPVLKYLGRVDLARMVSDRAMRYAEETGDALLTMAGAWNLSQSMLSDDMPEGAEEIALTAAEKLEPALADGTPAHFSLYGALKLNASVAAVRRGDPWRGRELVREVRPVAARIGERNDFHTVFGPTNVALYAVSLEAEAGEMTDALRLADEVDEAGFAALPSVERRTSHLFRVARCYDMRGDDPAVLVHLLRAERECPEELRQNVLVRSLMTGLLRRARPSYAPEVRELAGRVGLLV